MDRVCDDHEPRVITRQKQRSVVIMSLDDYKALEETAYLLKSPANARRLLAATKQLAKIRTNQIRALAHNEIHHARPFAPVLQ